jgi:hypothetical protein
MVIMAAVLAVTSPGAVGQAQAKGTGVGATNPGAFDPHDLSGVWRLPLNGPKSSLLFRSSEPAPALTEWGTKHMFPGGITHGPHPVPSGHFPGENCNPIGSAAQFSYLRFYPFEIVQTAGRVLQLYELHREWRNIWINTEHPKDLTPTYMGDSVAHWEGNTLVVDTIGFNGKDWITEDVPYPMSKDFHMVERYTRLDHDTLRVEIAFSDSKLWGDKTWGGFIRILKLQPDQLQEWICVPEVDAQFNEKIMKPTYGSEHLNLPKNDSQGAPKQ